MKRLTAGLVVVVLAGLTPLTSLHAAGGQAPRQSTDQRIAELRESYDEALAAEADLLAGIQVARENKQALDARLGELDGVLRRVEAELDAAEQRLAAATEQAEQAEGEARRTSDELAAADTALRAQAVEAYVGQGSNQDLAVLATQGDTLDDLAAMATYTAWMVEGQRQVVDLRSSLQEDARLLADRLESARQRVATETEEVADREAEAQKARDDQAALRDAAAAEVARQESLVAEVQSRKQQYLDRIAELQAESAKVAALVTSRAPTAGPPAASGNGDLAFPVPGFSVGSRRFGVQRHPIFGDSRMHSGVDIGAPTGTPIVAAESGSVASAGWRGGYGNTIVIDHGGGLSTLYAHMNSFAVQGGSVGRGQVIGYVGSTGNSTGAHLHFEVRRNGSPVDPMGYL